MIVSLIRWFKSGHEVSYLVIFSFCQANDMKIVYIRKGI